MRVAVSVFALAALVACSGSTNPTSGALKLGIVSGNNQTALASKQQLTDPVIGKLVRSADGTVSFHWIDALLPTKAYAQGGTTVTGSPVPGAVVCAVSIDPTHKLDPFVPCTNTDANGQATFFFTTGTTAGVSKAEIRGTLNSSPAVFDTAQATVLPDTTPANAFLVNFPSNDLGTLSIGDTVRLDALLNVVDKYTNPMTVWSAKWGFSTDTATSCCLPPQPPLTGVGHKPVVTANARTLFVQMGSNATFVQWFKLKTNVP